jgi:hypothetical protein
MNVIIQKCIDAATTKKQSCYIDIETLEPKPIFKLQDDGTPEPVYYEVFDKEQFAYLIIQKCLNVMLRAEGDIDWAIFEIERIFAEE